MNQANEKINPGHDFRHEKAINLLTYWAYRHYVGRENIDQGAHCTGGNPIASINPAITYKPFCFKMKTNAKQDRPEGKSSIPLGGVMRTETNDRRAVAIDKLLTEKLNPRGKLMVFYLFLPRHEYGIENLKDYQIAMAVGFSVKRASEVKCRAVRLVAMNVLSPFVDG